MQFAEPRTVRGTSVTHPAVALLLCLLTGCAARTEVLRRTLVAHPVELRQCGQVIKADLEPSWPTTTVHLYGCEQCEEVTTEEWEVVRGKKGNGAVATFLGGLAVTGGAYGLLSVAVPPPPVGSAISPLGTVLAVGVCIGTSALGALAGKGLLMAWEKSTETSELRTEPGLVQRIEHGRRPLEGFVELGVRRPIRRGSVELTAPELLGLEGSSLRVNDASIALDSQQLALARTCARAHAGQSTDPSAMTDEALEAAFHDANGCFEAGVSAADRAVTRLARERLNRLRAPVPAAPLR
jgi:hypothetical protein